jgi:hypothetical protein
MRGSSETSNRRALPHTPAVDGRKHLAKKIRTVMREIIADNGGLTQLSETKLQLIKRFAAASVLAEAMEANVCNGYAVDVMELTALTTAMIRISARIGVRRRPKVIDVERAARVAEDHHRLTTVFQQVGDPDHQEIGENDHDDAPF